MKLTVIEAPNQIFRTSFMTKTSVFLAGGITNCPDWQAEVIKRLEDEDVALYNPRRKNFPIEDPNASDEQITWEYVQLRDSDIIVFWFSKGSLNPIVLYELGRWGNSSNNPIVIGIDPGYERTQDVVIQTKLSRPKLKINYNMDDFIKAIKLEIIEIASKRGEIKEVKEIGFKKHNTKNNK